MGQGSPISPTELDQAVTYIAEQGIKDVVLTGGDPLAAPRKVLLSAIEHLVAVGVQKIRIDTRALSTNPSAFIDGNGTLLEALSQFSPRVDIYAHMNHVADLDHPHIIEAVQRCRKAGLTVYNQSVLLGGVNDDPSSLQRLGTLLYEQGIIWYVLYLPDPVEGTEHFAVEDAQIGNIITALGELLCGPAIPQVVYVGDDDQKHRLCPGSPGLEEFLALRSSAIARMIARKAK